MILSASQVLSYVYLKVEDADESEIESAGRWIGESKIPELVDYELELASYIAIA